MRKEKWWVAPLLVWSLSFLSLVIFDIFIKWFGPDLKINMAGGWLVYLLPFFVIFAYTRREKKKLWSEVGVGKKNFGWGIIWVFALSIVFLSILSTYSEAVTRITGKNPGEELAKHFEQTLPDWYLAYMMLSSFIPVGLFEEAIFRGFLLNKLLVKGTAFAIITSSVMHASLHLWYLKLGGAGIAMYGSAFIFFVWMGIVYFKTRNIVGLALMHGLNNALIPIKHFFGGQAVLLVWMGVFAMGIFCLMYLVFSYMGRQIQRSFDASVEARILASKRTRLENMHKRMQDLLKELKKRRTKGDISREDYVRLKEKYQTRIKQIEEMLRRA